MKNKLIILLGAILVIAGIGLSMENRFATNIADTTHNNRIEQKEKQNTNQAPKQETNKNANENMNKTDNKEVNNTSKVSTQAETDNTQNSYYGEYKLENAMSYIAGIMMQGETSLNISKDSLKLMGMSSNIIFEQANPEFSTQNVDNARFTSIYGVSAKSLGIDADTMIVYTLKNSGESGFEFTQMANGNIIASYNGSAYIFKNTNNK